MRGGTVDDTVLFGPWPTSGNIGHRKGCGGRCHAFGEMVKSCSKGSAPAYDRLQTNNAGTVHKQKAYWYRCPEGLSSPVPHGNDVSPLCCRGLKQDTARGPAGENHRISENCIRDASSRCSDGALRTRQKNKHSNWPEHTRSPSAPCPVDVRKLRPMALRVPLSTSQRALPTRQRRTLPLTRCCIRPRRTSAQLLPSSSLSLCSLLRPRRTQTARGTWVRPQSGNT